ncbi:MAG: 30S ribosomal protein S16 [Candidatus Peribacteraceae bacterium]|nr:30S ribosomal protein S16 [Candidatus Peribacteraceae bacterium]
MLKIRLQRTGRENIPTYRIVVAEKRNPVKGGFLEVLGFYLPARDPVVFEHKDERILHWIGKGAVPSETVARLLRRAGMKDMDKYISTYTKKKSKKAAPEGDAPAPAAAPAAPAETGDTPAAQA